MTEEANEFIAELEKRFSGTIGYRTYSTWFAASDGIVRSFGVFVFQIGTLLHFEDFERKPSMFGIPLNPKRKKEAYRKYEGTIDVSEIRDISQVSKKRALECVLSEVDSTKIPPATPFQRLFIQLVTRVILNDGTTYFFELINHKEFITSIHKDN
ncbi:MAG: hypothetical protein JXK93_07110 [Sphaerochaetaceae bacterium]|nr:hypothetical protein [Sphaerochaetaceae bacterium]